MQKHHDKIFLEQLKKEDSASFQLLYKYYFPTIASYIKQNSGNNEDAKDIFQESIIVLLEKVKQPQFTLTSSLKTYLYAIARNLWLKRLRDDRIVPVDEVEKYQNKSEMFYFELHEEHSREEKAASWISRVTMNCQRILKALFFDHEPINHVMKKMGWKNKRVAASQQYKCIEQVRKEKRNDEKLSRLNS